ncbi:MAG: hypothetical protein R2879_21095 [Saprospiraceae bacterium]
MNNSDINFKDKPSRARRRLIQTLNSFNDPEKLWPIVEKILKYFETSNGRKNKIIELKKEQLKSLESRANSFPNIHKESIQDEIIQLKENISNGINELEDSNENINNWKLFLRSLIDGLKSNPQGIQKIVSSITSIVNSTKYQISFIQIFLTELYINSNSQQLDRLNDDIEYRIERLKEIISPDIKDSQIAQYVITEKKDIDFALLLYLTIRQTPEDEVINLLNFQENIQGTDFPNTLSSYFKTYSNQLNSSQKSIVEDWIIKKNELLSAKIDQESNRVFEKIEWNGSQKELGELFVELKKKGWVNNLPFKTIKAAFTKSNSIDQALLPKYDKKTYQSTYSNIYTEKYRPKFDTIRPNPKTKEG